MYYLMNLVSTMFITIAIAIVYNNSASSGVILAFLLIAACFHVFASAYATSKYYALKTRIEKLENKKEDK